MCRADTEKEKLKRKKASREKDLDAKQHQNGLSACFSLLFMDIFGFHIDLYTLFFAIGIFSAFLYLRVFSGYGGISNRVYNFTIILGALSSVVGIYSSVLFQAIYNFGAGEDFVLDGTGGATFGGGLVGGAAFFLFVYFVFGERIAKSTREEFLPLLSLIFGAIPLAHCFGRIGCFFAGCCYGRETECGIGVYYEHLGKRVVPLQLFEAAFLFLLSVVTVYLIIKKWRYTPALYPAAYGVWRFIIEFFRGDDRGELFGISFLSPSQIISLLLIICGAALALYISKKGKKGEHDEER